MQNPSMRMTEFIEFCEKRGIVTSKDELEYFEKEKLLTPVDYNNGVGLYSSFQIHWLDKLKKAFLIILNLAGNIKKCSSSTVIGGIKTRANFEFNDLSDFNITLGKISADPRFEKHFNFNIKEQELREEYKRFAEISDFLISIQSVYYPYARSGGGKIQIYGDYKKWQKLENEFKLDKILINSNLKLQDIVSYYRMYSVEAREILGAENDDWIQLWKNINWEEKDGLKGNVRLGIEYLQWAVMLKRVIEDYIGKDILDIDEMSNIGAADVLKIDINAKDKAGLLLRHSRNTFYSDSEKNYYNDRYKRLFYLCNDFGLDYQPRVIVFVEGRTEEVILPEVFRKYIGDRPENLGIEFINFEGVGKLLSTANNAERLRKLLIELEKEERQQILSKGKNSELNKVIRDLKNIDIIISNWTSFLKYNLEKWQIIPFFVSDNEGNVKHFLDSEKPIEYLDVMYNVPSSWKYLWGISNDNKPFVGKDFEMANFNDREISTALSKILNKNIQVSEVKTQRDNKFGINKIDPNVDTSGNKVKIARELFEQLFNRYNQTEDKSLLERPIFKAIERIEELAILNHPSVNRKIELENREYIIKELSGKK